MRSLKNLFCLFQNSIRCYKSIVYVGGNIGKGLEIEKILEDVVTIDFFNIDLPEIQDELIENIAFEKCNLAYREVWKAQGSPEAVMVEDTSLAFDSLGGLPGPYIRSFIDKVGVDGLHQILTGFEDKGCVASCCVALKESSDDEPILFVGTIRGQIVSPRGKRDFGWDSIFLPDGYDQTFSEMKPEIKNSISHRFKAFNLLHEYLFDVFETKLK